MATCGGEVFPSDRTFPGPYLTRQNPMPFPPDRTFPGPYLTRLSSLPDRTRNTAFRNATVLLLSTVAWEAHRGTAGMAYPRVKNPMAFPPDRTFPGPYLTRLSSLPDRTRNAACNNATVLLLSTVAWEAHRGLRPRGGTPRVGRRRRVRRSRGVAMSARIDALVFLLILT